MASGVMLQLSNGVCTLRGAEKVLGVEPPDSDTTEGEPEKETSSQGAVCELAVWDAGESELKVQDKVSV